MTDIEELVQLFAQLIEDASDTVAVERALAGAVRLASRPAAERARLAGPLLKRAERQAEEDWLGPYSGHAIRADMARLTRSWATGQRPFAGRRDPGREFGGRPGVVSRSGLALTMGGILTARIAEAAARVAARVAAPLLAEPEFADGMIGHDTLLARLALAGPGSVPRHDLGVAVLRLAPGADDAFWAEWARIDDRSAAAARRAYAEAAASLDLTLTADGPYQPCVSAQLAAAPLAAAPLAAAPLAAAPPAGASRPAPAPAAYCWRLLTELTSQALAEHGRHGIAAQMGYRVRWDEVVAAWPLLAPHQPELIAAHLLRPLSDGLEAGRSAATVAAGSLASSGRPLGKAGHSALITAFASAEADTRIAAAETWTRAAADGRLDPVLAADAITRGVTGHAFKVNRLADAMQHAAAQGSAAALAVAHAAMLATADLLTVRPAGLHLLPEVAARAIATSAEAGTVGQAAAFAVPPSFAVPPALAGLAGSRDRTKLAEAARRVVRLTTG